MNFTIDERVLKPGHTVLDLTGEVDVMSAPVLKETIISHIGRGTSHIIVNLEKVDYLDSTGLGTLIGGLKRTREAKTRLSIVGMNARLRRLFDITGIDKIFAIHDTVDQAVAAVEESQ
jgi:anti-sigma B factor antagonist